MLDHYEDFFGLKNADEMSSFYVQGPEVDFRRFRHI